MIQLVLLYMGAALPLLWGVAHLFPTKSVVSGFGEITLDNRRIITMEWIVEGVAFLLIGALVTTVTVIDPAAAVSRAVYLVLCVGLVALAAVALFTGFRVRFLPFRLCPLVLTVSAALVLAGALSAT